MTEGMRLKWIYLGRYIPPPPFPQRKTLFSTSLISLLKIQRVSWRTRSSLGPFIPILPSHLCIWGWLKSLSTTTPLTSMVSSSLPPTLLSTLMSSKSTSLLSRSATAMMALTAISAIFLWKRLMLWKWRITEMGSLLPAILAIFTAYIV